jgi:hypothetical protein
MSVMLDDYFRLALYADTIVKINSTARSPANRPLAKSDGC